MGSLKIILMDGVGGDLGFSGCLWGDFYCFLRRKNTCFGIVYVCRMNYNTQQIPHGIDNNMPFTTFKNLYSLFP